MNERRRIFLGNNNKLNELAYIETTGTQYIDTGYKPNNKTRIYAKMRTTESTPYGRFFGASSGPNYNSAPVVEMNYESNWNGTLHVMWGNVTGWTNISSIVGDYNTHEMEFNRGVVYYDGVQVYNFNDTDTWETTTNMAIFDYFKSTGISGGNERMKGRVYAFKVWDDDVLVRDFVPVEVEGVGYLYDKVSKQLFGNQGTGDFICGPRKSNYNKVLMTSTTNPEVLAICYAQGWCADSSYMSYGEAGDVGDIGTVFRESNITHFEEFKYFTDCSALNNDAFNGCSSLENIILPLSVRSIGYRIFKNCTSLRTISGYDNITSITGESHFEGCSSLESFNWKWNWFPQACFVYCRSLLLDFNPNIINSVDANALGEVSFTITDFNLSLTRSNINYAAFAGTNVKKITFWGSTCTIIYQYAFTNCIYLESIDIPQSVSTIYNSAFRNCTNLKEIRCGGYNAPDLSLDEYDQANFPTNGVIKVPIGATGYDQGGWGYLVNNKGWTIVYQDIYPRKYSYTNQLIEFTRVEYLESNGSNTQYINLKYVPNDNTETTIDCKPDDSMNSTSSREIIPVGSDYDYSSNKAWRLKMDQWFLESKVAKSDNECNYSFRGTTRHTYKWSNSEFYLDGVLKRSVTPTTGYWDSYNSNYTLYLFKGGASSTDFFGRIYSFKIEENGTTIMDLVPGRFGDSVGCMYDKISGKIFYSEGGQPFTCGPDLI